MNYEICSFFSQSVQNQCPQSRESTPHEERVLSDRTWIFVDYVITRQIYKA